MDSDSKKEKFFNSFKREYREIKKFYLSEAQKKKLQKMFFLRRFFVFNFLILKALYLKLQSTRRIIFLLAIIFLFQADVSFTYQKYSYHLQSRFLAGILLLFLLLLELKDKLLIRNEILAARAIQSALSPEAQPKISGFDTYLFCQPVNEVGGDLVDCIALPDQSHIIALADISGKGLSAALLMSKLKGFIHAFARDTPFGNMMDVLNTKFYHTIPRQSFASLLLIRLPLDNPQIQILNAGHLPPLLVTKSGIVSLNKGGLAIGLRPENSYSVQSVRLNPTDIFIAYSDGLTEAFNDNGEQFGEERLMQTLKENRSLTANKIAERILKEVSGFSDQQYLKDDLSLIVIKKK